MYIYMYTDQFNVMKTYTIHTYYNGLIHGILHVHIHVFTVLIRILLYIYTVYTVL